MAARNCSVMRDAHQGPVTLELDNGETMMMGLPWGGRGSWGSSLDYVEVSSNIIVD